MKAAVVPSQFNKDSMQDVGGIFEKIYRKAALGSQNSYDGYVVSSLQNLGSEYEYCFRIIKNHSKTFSLAASLLGREQRNGIIALYAFCRTTDDIVDRNPHNRKALLERWKAEAVGFSPRINDPVSLCWAETRSRFKIPRNYIQHLIEGVESDLRKQKYQSVNELIEYCYGVASTVGLMSIHILGFESEKAIPYAIKMGIALQLTNILRDVGEDYRMGRIYLPQDEMDEFGIKETHFSQGLVDENWKRFMKFQIEKTRLYYEESWEGLKYLSGKGRLAIEAASCLYREILRKIEENGYDNFSNRAYVPKREKWMLLTKIISKKAVGKWLKK
ncbi:MAG: phytoene/squalene synthase family protein [Saprospiraceae bacterium]|nr:phytoene/squalene synthase family protein [Saprospiraceae bacterium]